MLKVKNSEFGGGARYNYMIVCGSQVKTFSTTYEL